MLKTVVKPAVLAVSRFGLVEPAAPTFYVHPYCDLYGNYTEKTQAGNVATILQYGPVSSFQIKMSIKRQF